MTVIKNTKMTVKKNTFKNKKTASESLPVKEKTQTLLIVQIRTLLVD